MIMKDEHSDSLFEVEDGTIEKTEKELQEKFKQELEEKFKEPITVNDFMEHLGIEPIKRDWNFQRMKAMKWGIRINNQPPRKKKDS